MDASATTQTVLRSGIVCLDGHSAHYLNSIDPQRALISALMEQTICQSHPSRHRAIRIPCSMRLVLFRLQHFGDKNRPANSDCGIQHCYDVRRVLPTEGGHLKVHGKIVSSRLHEHPSDDLRHVGRKAPITTTIERVQQ